MKNLKKKEYKPLKIVGSNKEQLQRRNRESVCNAIKGKHA